MESNEETLRLKDQAAELFKSQNYKESIEKYEEALEKIQHEDKELKS